MTTQSTADDTPPGTLEATAGLSNRVVRDRRADVIRGMAIAAVVYIHADAMIDIGRPTVIPAAGFRWCVPTFVILAAFFAVRPTRVSSGGRLAYFTVVGRRLARLMWPFVVWSLVYFFVRRAWRTGSPVSILAAYALGFGWAGQYYFVILIQAAFLLPLLAGRRVHIGYVVAAVVVLAFWSALPSWVAGWNRTSVGRASLDDRLVVFWVPYLLLGAWLSHRWQGRLGRVMPPVLGWTTLVSSTLLLAVVPTPDRGSPHGFTPYQNPELALLMPLIFFALCSVAGSLPAMATWLLALSGEYSLGVFCMNPLMDGMAVRRLLAGTHVAHWLSVPASVVIPVAETGVIVAAGVIISVALDRCGLSRLVR